MKILIICTEKLPVPPIRGGAIQTYIAGALPNLRHKHQITVLGRSDASLPDDELQDGVRYCRVGGGLLEIYRDNVVDFLQSSSERYDLIHIFNRPRLVNPIRALAPNSKIVLSMHNDMFKPEKIDPEEGAAVVENVDKIITISNYIGQTIQDLFPAAAPKLQTIYSGVDLDRFVPSYSPKATTIRSRIRKEHNLTNKKVILYAGRLSPNKGIDVLIRAIPELAKKHKDIALVIMGSKWFSDNSITDYIAYVRALADRLPIPVIQTGFVSPDKIHEWFVASDLFVCTSQWQEPLARVHYEAMAAALPIVTTNRGGNTEVIEPHKNGIVVENPPNPGEFVEHISYLLSNPEKGKNMGRYGRTLAEQYYSWDRVVNDIASVWDEMENMPVKKTETIHSTEPDQQAEENTVVLPEETIPIESGIEVEKEKSPKPEEPAPIEHSQKTKRRRWLGRETTGSRFPEKVEELSRMYQEPTSGGDSLPQDNSVQTGKEDIPGMKNEEHSLTNIEDESSSNALFVEDEESSSIEMFTEESSSAEAEQVEKPRRKLIWKQK
ncbi:glycosyltransferase family 4 protein [Thalassobacillus pellis]|uniref:glycosyltransferase family 4 protein n=1 Tax=Thalassobacillus pellis TaxID=748008 RepID=UPI0019602809|nr:glycosyltransferase family 4 protein [Thalassobacillus pellis]MBM7553326.1 spore coat protein SA [Thalassobacillus pellis]